MVSHNFVTFREFDVGERDQNEATLRHVKINSSGQDLVEEFSSYGVWPLGHGWVIGETTR